MLETIKDTLRKSDYFMLLLMVILAVISFSAIYSAVYDPSTGEVQNHPYKQIRVFAFGLLSYATISFVGYRRIVKYAIPLYILGCIFLVVVKFKGFSGMGAQRWLLIGSLSIQPSELFKWVWVVMLAWVFNDLQSESMGLLKIMRKFIWLIPPFLLVFFQPDLGTAATYLMTWGLVVLFLGVKRSIIGLMLIVLFVSAPVAWGHLKDYQKMRVITFIAPDKYAGKEGYQAIQARIAIGSGGLTGKGYLKGTQSHLRFMPERHTDFIFAVINEEFGFAGGITVIGIFFVLISRIIYIAAQLKDAHGKMLCVSIASFIFFQFFVNVGMTIGLAPVVGVPLPFVSAGGSSLLTFISMLGLINSVYISKAGDNFI
ncbi:MAG: rod shape-determining protein RodA [Deferribacteraceae bacterium]|jgi:rod shape determining protein RodA|nr:rod shape-determining protein RodA [Deferribacteraceae bacterium]